jgi:AraC-like DNA-binding protein
MHHQEFEPPEVLQNSIKCFWYLQRDFGSTPTQFEVVPDGYAEIIFYVGQLSNTTQDGSGEVLSSPFIMGLLNQPAHFCSEGALTIIGIRCYPWTVFDLLGLPPGRDGLRMFEHPITRLQSSVDRWVRAGNLTEAIHCITQYFLEARSGVEMDGTLFKAGTAMRDANGTLPVSQVAAAAHATVRTLERKFRQSSGYSVKDVSGLMRFEQVRNHLWQYPDANLAALALELGYADQSHLSREFKRYSGTTPAAFAREQRKKGRL